MATTLRLSSGQDLKKLQELTCNRLDKYILLNSGAVVYNGFVFKDTAELVKSIFTENTLLIFIERIEVLEV